LFLKYHPEGATEPTTYEFLPGRVRVSRAQLVEKVYSRALGEKATWEQFKIAVVQGSIAARRVLLWLLMSQIHPTLRYEDVPDFYEDEVTVEWSRQELQDMYDGLERAQMPDGEKETLLARLREEIAGAPTGDDDPLPEADQGKASPICEPPTG
jgi:hypothetical protein